MPSKVCIRESALENDTTQYDIVHVSVGAQTAMVRRWPEEANDWRPETVSPDEGRSYITNAALTLTLEEAFEMAGIVPEGSPKYANRQWQVVFRALRRRLDEGGVAGLIAACAPPPPGGGNRPSAAVAGRPQPPEPPTPIIPLTALRKIYDPGLRHILYAIGFHELLCSKQVELASLLAHYFRQASKDFDPYNNETDAFAPGGGDDLQRQEATLKYAVTPGDFAKCLQARLIRTGRGLELPAVNGAPFSYVDFEISPYRTTGNARFSDGTPARGCGGGGMDLLLRSWNGNLPVIGEIKAPGDTSMLLALVQALTYASELCTRNQVARLRRSYEGEHFGETVRCDIALFFSSKDQPRLLMEAQAIANALLKKLGKVDQRRIRNIRFIEVTLPTPPDSRPVFREVQ